MQNMNFLWLGARFEGHLDPEFLYLFHFLKLFSGTFPMVGGRTAEHEFLLA